MENPKGVDYREVLNLLQMTHDKGLNIIKTENLYLMDGKPMFTAAQGQ
jgi:isocitrate dehydrogenase